MRTTKMWSMSKPRVAGTVFHDTFRFRNLFGEDGDIQDLLGVGVIFRSTAKYFQQFAYGDTGHVHIELMSNKDQVCTAMEAHGSLYCPSRDPKRVPQRLRQRRVVREQRGAVADETLWYTSAHVGSLSRVPELGGAFR